MDSLVRRLREHWRLLAWVGAVIVILAVYVLGAVAAVSGYQKRLSSQSLSYDGHLEFSGSDFLSTLTTDMAFSGGLSRTGDLAASTQFLGSWAGHDYSGEARITGGLLYYNVSGPDMPVIRYRQTANLIPLKPGVWYSNKLGVSLYDNYCDRAGDASVGAKLALYRTIKTLHITPSPWVDYFAIRGPYHAVHVSGSLPGSQLAALYQAATKAEPEGCDSFNTLGISAEDLKHVSTHVDLYSNEDHDELIITLQDKTLGAKARIVLTTYNYDRPVQVALPTGVTNLNALFSTLPNVPKAPAD
jgi:hypothetical protein